MATAEEMVPHLSAADKTALSKGKRGGKKQSKRLQISSTEWEEMISEASSSKPWSTQRLKIEVVETKSPPFTPS